LGEVGANEGSDRAIALDDEMRSHMSETGSTYTGGDYIGIRTYADSTERNESQEILDCIKANGPITAEEISQKTEWNRHLVDVALGLMIERGLIYQAGVTEDEWKDPVYKIVRRDISSEQYKQEYNGAFNE
jgi:predicted HTH transcriptional regulator